MDPTNEKAQNIVKKLEPMTATQYDKTGFAFKNVEEIAQHILVSSSEVKEDGPPVLHPIPKEIISGKRKEQFEAQSSIVEALIYRKEFVKARQFLQEMKNIYDHNKKASTHIQKLERKIPSIDKEPKRGEVGKDSFSPDNTVFASTSHLDKGLKNSILGSHTVYNTVVTSQKEAEPSSVHGLDQKRSSITKGVEKNLFPEGVKKQREHSHQVSTRSQNRQKKIKKLQRLFNRIESIESHVAHQN